tara:strand:+ start:3801 stop:3938 length:138 start_codon:yes stop_codon:yes gene_type:complete
MTTVAHKETNLDFHIVTAFSFEEFSEAASLIAPNKHQASPHCKHQ